MDDLILSSLQTQELNHHGKELGAVYGAGAISTEVAPKVTVSEVNGLIVTKVYLDLTGLKKVSDVGDAIGLDGTANASLFSWDSAVHGDVLVESSLACIELPTAASNVLLDFDVLSATATLAYDGDVAGESDAKTLFAAGGNCAKGKTIQDLDVESPATSGDKVYLCDGATSTGADTFTAGKLVLTFKAYKSF